MSDSDRDDLSGIDPLEDAEVAVKMNISETDAAAGELMDKTDGSSKNVEIADATLTSGYVSRSFPSLTSLSKSLPVSPDAEKQISLGRYSAVHRSAGTDKENADKYRRPVGGGPRVQLFPDAGEMCRTRSDNATVGHIIKRPCKSISRSLTSPPPDATDSMSQCYFSRDKFFQLTPEVEPLIVNDLNNNDNNAGVSEKQIGPNTTDVRTKVSETAGENIDDPVQSVPSKQVPPLSIEELVNISSVSDVDLEHDEDGSLDQSAESLDFQQDSEKVTATETSGAGSAENRVPRSFYKDDESLMGELAIDQAFRLSLGSSASSDDEEGSQHCQMPPMDLQPIIYNDLDKTFTESPVASVTNPHDPDSSSVSEKKETRPSQDTEESLKSDAQFSILGVDLFKESEKDQEENLGTCDHKVVSTEVAGRLREEIVQGDFEDYQNANLGRPQHFSRKDPESNDYCEQKERTVEREVLHSMGGSQSSNGLNSEQSSSIHGPALDPMATHDLSISSSIYSYLGKASRPQEIAQDAENLKTSSPLVNRAQVQEFLQKNVREMDSIEPLRDHVRNVLRLTETILPNKSSYDHSGDDLLLGNHFGSDDLTMLSDFNNARGRNSSYVPNYIDNLGLRSGFLFDQNVQNGSNMMNSSALYVENQTLKDTLEKERFRRRHVEKQIATCQSQILELQEQLAVAVSMSRKKDSIIEQLDKALAKVANGWKRKDAESKELVQKLQQENETLNTRGQHQQEMAARLERELSTMVEKLKQEQQRAAQVERETDRQLKELQEEKGRAMERLQQVEDHLRTITDERDQLQSSKDRLQGQLLDLRQALDSERESWEEKEKEYLQKIDEITANHLKSVDQEKRKTAMAVQTLEETEVVLTTVQNEMSRLGMQLEAATREKESLKVEMGIQEARYESARRKLEADLRADYEKQMSQKLSEAHKRQAKNEEEMRERHRRQVVELNARHAQEIEEMTKTYQEEIRDKEDKMRQQSLEFEERLTESTEENEALQSEVKKLEGQRQEITSKLQEMMQAHCSEALSLLKVGSAEFHAGKKTVLTDPLPHQNSQFEVKTTGVSVALTETSWSTPTIVSSSVAPSGEPPRTSEVSAWNTSSLSYQSGISLGDTLHESDGRYENLSSAQIPGTYVSQDGPVSQVPPTSWASSQAPPFSWFPSQAPPTSWSGSQAPGAQNVSHSSYGLSSIAQLPNASEKTQASAVPQHRNLFDSQAPLFSQTTSFVNHTHPDSGYNTSFDFAAQLGAKYSSLFQYQAPPTSDQTPPIVFHTSLGGVSDQASIKDYGKSFEYQAPPTGQHVSEVGIARESYEQNSAAQELQLSYREDATKSSLYDPTSSTGPTHQELPPPMYTSSPPRGRGYYASKAHPSELGSSQGSNFLRQLVDSVEEDEFQVLREDTTIESNTEETESHPSPQKTEDVVMGEGKERPLQGDISGISERFHEHQNRQAELQHYIRMLLQRSPGSIPSTSDGNRTFTEEEPTRDTSLGNIYSPIRNPQPDPVIVSGQGQPEVRRSAFEKKLVSAKDLPPVSGLSPKQVGEIAKLIGQYRSHPQGDQVQQAPSAFQSVHSRNYRQSEESTSSSERTPPRTVISKKSHISSKEPLTKDKVKKNLGVVFTEVTREQTSKQEAVPRPSANKQHQGAAAFKGPVKKVGVGKNRTADERKQIHKAEREKKVNKVWK